MSRPRTASGADSVSDVRSGVPLTNSLTHSRTNGESWLSRGDHLTFRNAHAHIRNSNLDSVRERMDAEASA